MLEDVDTGEKVAVIKPGSFRLRSDAFVMEAAPELFSIVLRLVEAETVADRQSALIEGSAVLDRIAQASRKR